MLDADEMNASEIHEKMFVNELKEKMMSMGKVEAFGQETTRDVERMAIIRVSTKHINLWMRQLEMKRNEMCKLAGLLEFVEVRREIEAEKSLEKWAKRVSNHFTKKVKKTLFEEIDNIVWSGKDKGIVEWCARNKVFDEITEEEIEEIWRREPPDEGEPIRLNGKYVWETAKRVCNYINAHEDTVKITTFEEYLQVM